MLQTDVMHQIFLQAPFDPNQEYTLHQLFDYLTQLTNREFPHDLIEKIRNNHPTHPTGNYFTPNDMVDMIYKEYQTQTKIKQEAGSQILFYRSEYKKLQDELVQARKEEHQNEYEIDDDSELSVLVSHAECLKLGQYQVMLKLFNSQLQTKLSEMTTQPSWKEEFKIHIPSPHGQLFVGLFNNDTLVGQLQLPLFQFKDQQHFTQDFLLENEYGVLINTKLKLNLTLWWVHSKVALIEDHLVYIDHFKKEINDQQILIDKCNQNIEYLLFTFNKSRIKRQQQQQIQQPVHHQSEEDLHWTISYQDCMYSIAKCFKSKVIPKLDEHQDSIEEWQKVVIVVSIIVTLFTLLLVCISRPCFQQLVISMSIGMLVWAYESNHIKTTKILAQISLILVIQCVFDTLWLIVNYQIWWQSKLILEQQLPGKFVLNELSYYCTIIYIPLDLLLAALSFNLSLKYLAQNQL